MIELERHIEILLLDNDCVIVPGLGGFVAHHADARFDGRDNTFLPPMRTLGFNPKLNMNDSLLAQSYVEAYDISYPEALGRIDQDVDELKQALERDGFYELSDIGVLTINAEGNYEFEPCESGILTPELYGLAGFSIERRADVQGEESTTAVVVELPVRKREAERQPQGARTGEAVVADTAAKSAAPFIGKELAESMGEGVQGGDRTISIKVSWLRNMFAAACAVVAFFMLATPISTEVYENGRKMSSMSGSGLLYNLVPKDGSAQPLIYNKVEKTAESLTLNGEAAAGAEAEAEKPEAKAAEPEKEKPADSQETKLQPEAKAQSDHYSIVLACRITRKNAEAFVERLHARGYTQARLLDEPGASLKVVYGEYATEGKAFTELDSLRENDIFAESWIYHVK